MNPVYFSASLEGRVQHLFAGATTFYPIPPPYVFYYNTKSTDDESFWIFRSSQPAAQRILDLSHHLCKAHCRPVIRAAVELLASHDLQPAEVVKEYHLQNITPCACRTRTDQDLEHGSVLLYLKTDRNDDDRCQAAYYDECPRTPRYCEEQAFAVGIKIATATGSEVKYLCETCLRRVVNHQSCCFQFRDPKTTSSNQYWARCSNEHNYHVHHGSCPHERCSLSNQLPNASPSLIMPPLTNDSGDMEVDSPVSRIRTASVLQLEASIGNTVTATQASPLEHTTSSFVVLSPPIGL